MTLNPAIQKQAQIAVDRVCSDRLPEFSDYDDIPYVHAVVMECLRWRPALPLGRLTKSSVSFFYGLFWYEPCHIRSPRTTIMRAILFLQNPLCSRISSGSLPAIQPDRHLQRIELCCLTPRRTPTRNSSGQLAS